MLFKLHNLGQLGIVPAVITTRVAARQPSRQQDTIAALLRRTRRAVMRSVPSGGGAAQSCRPAQSTGQCSQRPSAGADMHNPFRSGDKKLLASAGGVIVPTAGGVLRQLDVGDNISRD